MGPTALLPLRRKACLKNPTASARFEPANLGTKGQHATSRPPKPLPLRLPLPYPFQSVCHFCLALSVSPLLLHITSVLPLAFKILRRDGHNNMMIAKDRSPKKRQWEEMHNKRTDVVRLWHSEDRVKVMRMGMYCRGSVERGRCWWLMETEGRVAQDGFNFASHTSIHLAHSLPPQ